MLVAASLRLQVSGGIQDAFWVKETDSKTLSLAYYCSLVPIMGRDILSPCSMSDCTCGCMSVKVSRMPICLVAQFTLYHKPTANAIGMKYQETFILHSSNTTTQYKGG